MRKRLDCLHAHYSNIEYIENALAPFKVHPNHFRKGIAQKLLTFIEGQFDKKTIIVATGSKNAPAVTLYKKNGFLVTKEVQVNGHLSLTYFEKKL